MNLDKAVTGLILTLAALCALLWAVTPEPGPEVSPLIQRAVEMGYFPCEEEDSPGPCYWDAQAQGNQQGKSFVATGDEVFYE